MKDLESDTWSIALYFLLIFFSMKSLARKVSRELDSSAKESAWGPWGGGGGEEDEPLALRVRDRAARSCGLSGVLCFALRIWKDCEHSS